MALSLFDITIAFRQTVGAMTGVLDRGLAHCMDNGVDPQTIVDARIHPDMLPFAFQIASVAHHSIGAIEAVKTGVFSPSTDFNMDYAGLQKKLAAANEALGKLTAAEVDGLAGKDVLFQMRDFKIPFVAEGFLLSFSLPNLHFHATTAYDILRSKGVPLGKRDYLGQLRMKGG